MEFAGKEVRNRLLLRVCPTDLFAAVAFDVSANISAELERRLELIISLTPKKEALTERTLCPRGVAAGGWQTLLVAHPEDEDHGASPREVTTTRGPSNRCEERASFNPSRKSFCQIRATTVLAGLLLSILGYPAGRTAGDGAGDGWLASIVAFTTSPQHNEVCCSPRCLCGGGFCRISISAELGGAAPFWTCTVNEWHRDTSSGVHGGDQVAFSEDGARPGDFFAWLDVQRSFLNFAPKGLTSHA